MSSKDSRRFGKGNYDSTKLANPAMVHKSIQHDHRYSKVAPSSTKTCIPTVKNSSASSKEQVTVNRMPIVRHHLRTRGISEGATNIIMASWRTGTQKQYHTYQTKWTKYCNEREYDSYYPTVAIVLDFLNSLFQSGLSYSALNTARSALSSVVTLGKHPLGSHPLVSRFLKGVYELRTPTCRYNYIWDVTGTLSYLRCLHPLGELSLKDLTLKLTMLIALVSAQRIQSLSLLDLNHLHWHDNSAVFVIQGHIKQSRPGLKPQHVILADYLQEERLSVYKVLVHYLKVTKPLRGKETRLLISFVKPHKAVTKDTISRWLKLVMSSAGTDISIFKPHSTRSASVSAAKSNSVPVDIILQTAGWSSEKTFAAFYNKPITVSSNFYAKAVLEHKK